MAGLRRALDRARWSLILSCLAVLPTSACSGIALVEPTSIPSATFTPKATPPIISSPIPISNESGTPIAEQPGFLEWVLLSGVDEHGLTAEHFLMLLAEPDPLAPVVAEIHTGHPVIVREIRHVGPQALRRFYFVETLDGKKGWISDFYVRRQAYLFNIEGTSVPLFNAPAGAQIGAFENVTPVTLLEPGDLNWWRVSSLDGSSLGWVQAQHVKESPEEEFLLGSGHDHECDQCPYFVP